MEYRELYEDFIKDIATEQAGLQEDDVHHYGVAEDSIGFSVDLYRSNKIISNQFVSTIEITKRLFKMLIEKEISE